MFSCRPFDSPEPLAIVDIISCISELRERLQRAVEQVGDVSQANQDERNKRKFVSRRENLNGIQDELNKLCLELHYMLISPEKHNKFSTNLREPLQTLEQNVTDILKDLPEVTDSYIPREIPVNLRVLGNNITRVEIQILPQLYNEDVFESSYYFKEIKEKYEALDKRHKLCLLCFAIFPEDAEINQRLLRFWWAGENLVLQQEGKDAKKIVRDTLQKFMEEGFIEPIRKDKLYPRSYKINPIVRSCLIKFAKEAWFFDYDQEGNPTMDFSCCKRACLLKLNSAATWFLKYLINTEKYLEQNPEAWRLPTDLVKLQSLFNFPTWDTLIKSSNQFHELQTLFNTSRQFPALSKEFFSKMTSISVLYLGRWESEAGPLRLIELDNIRGLENMNKLKILSLQGTFGIPRLPNSICKLANLRILDLRACHNLEKLPDKIGLLKTLTYLDISDCYLLDHMPKQLNKLSELEVLKGFVIGNAKFSCTLEDLTKLEKLRKLRVKVNTKDFNIENAGKALSKFQKLEKLRIAWGYRSSTGKSSKSIKQEVENNKKREQQEDSKEQTIGQAKSAGLKPEDKKGAGLERLRRVGNAIRAVNKLRVNGLKINLVKLDLRCFPNKAPPTWLAPGTLKNLENLSIRGGTLGYLTKDDEKWKKVKILRLKFLINFKMSLKDMLNQFPKLECLDNIRCRRVTFCPSGVWLRRSIDGSENVWSLLESHHDW